jgi:hypothetical protein
VLRRLFGPKKDEVTVGCRKLLIMCAPTCKAIKAGDRPAAEDQSSQTRQVFPYSEKSGDICANTLDYEYYKSPVNVVY